MKTKNEKLQHILREKFPELKELREGCRFTEQFCCEATILRSYTIPDESNVYDYSYNKPNAEDLSFARSPENPLWKIIGHTPDVSHVLRALDEVTMTGEEGEYAVTMQGFLQKNGVDLPEQPKLPLNLPLPQWPEEVCKQLVDLIE